MDLKLPSTIDPSVFARVRAAIGASVAKSLETNPVSADKLDREIRVRAELAMGLLGAMSADLGWSLARCLDHLTMALRCKLDGVPWEPSKRAVWLADG